MPRKVQPRWGWTPEADKADFEVRWKSVDKQLVIKLLCASSGDNSAQQLRIISSIMETFHWAYFRSDYPSNAEVRAAFKELKNAASEFERKFFQLDWLSTQSLTNHIKTAIEGQEDQHLADECQEFYDMLFSDPYRGRDMLAFLFKAIGTIKLKERPARKGRPGNYPVKSLIIHLARYYEKCTGQKASKGVSPNPITGDFDAGFVQLVEHLLRCFDPELKLSHVAIGEQIRSTIGGRSGPEAEEVLDAFATDSNEDVVISRVFFSELRVAEDGSVEEHVLFSSQVKRPRGWSSN